MEMNYKELIINKSATIIEAMKQLDKTAKKILFVVDDEKYMGSLTDGDVRRYILKTGKLDGLVLDACNKDSYYVKIGYNKNDVLEYMKKKDLKYVPVIDDNGFILELLLNADKESNLKINLLKKLNIPVVIMAGGFGSRLEPFTKVLPKPLIPIGEKTILEIIIDKFIDYGVNYVWLSVNYKSDIIKSYLSEQNLPCTINYIQEDKPLGTIGSLYLLKNKLDSELFILTNCDIIIDIDYLDLVEFHKKMENDVTIVSSAITYKIPYGVCRIKDGGILQNIEEKPDLNFLVSTGMYVINSKLVDIIPKNSFYNATDFIEKSISEGFKVSVYPISENSWIDIGQWDEYKKAIGRLSI